MSHLIDNLVVRGPLTLANYGNNRTTVLTADSADARSQVLRSALGYYAETHPRTGLVNNSIQVSGTIYAVAIGLLAGDVVTNIICSCNTAGATLTLVKLGIYDAAGTLIGVTTDVKAAFASTGAIASQLSTPLTITRTDGYYAAMITTGTTPPTLDRSATAAAAVGAAPGGMRLSSTMASQTDLVANATFGAASPIAYWFGVS